MESIQNHYHAPVFLQIQNIFFLYNIRLSCRQGLNYNATPGIWHLAKKGVATNENMSKITKGSLTYLLCEYTEKKIL